jgi:hemolysin activation/secretion protein
VALVRLWGTAQLLALFALVALPAAAQRPGGAPQSYPVSAFVIEYPLPHPDLPQPAELLDLEVEMRVTRGGLMQPHPTTENVRFQLGAVPPGSRFWDTGLVHVNRAILAEFARRGIGGVLITLPDLEERSGRDLRAPGEQRLRVRVWTGRVENVATIADGDRFAGTVDERTNRLEHRFVRDESPVRAGGQDSLIRTESLEDYTRRLSRHPGRRVDAVLEPGETPGATRLAYHVAEQKPWLAYAQLGNYGTEATTDWRERFGFSHNQLTGHDDILRLDYVTGNFEDVHAGSGSYEAPIWQLDFLRARAFGAYSEYDASEVGVSRLDFSGTQWEAGGRLIANLWQWHALFLDAYGGARWRNVTVENSFLLGAVGGEAEEDFFLPEVGIAVSHAALWSRLDLEVGWETNLGSTADTGDRADLLQLGRTDPDRDFSLVKWGGAFSFYLEPIVLARRGWGDPGSPGRNTLAHEVVIATRGQWAYDDDRLVPQFQQVAGGQFTVRGYEQSIVAGDSAVIGTLEYRWHLARTLDPGGEPIELPFVGPFQLQPRTVYSRADWDLILKAFLDGAELWSSNSNDPSVNDDEAEPDEDLFAAGVGVELQFMRYLRAGVDLAWPRSKLADESRGGDSPEIHVLVTLMF